MPLTRQKVGIGEIQVQNTVGQVPKSDMASATTTMSLFDACINRQLASSGRDFLQKFTQIRRMTGGGENTPQGKAPKPILRRSSRINPIPDKKEVDEQLAPEHRRRRRRRASIGVQQVEEDDSYDVPNQPKKQVKFTKKVGVRLFEMVEGSPRRILQGVRRRVQMGEQLDVPVPRNLRRLSKPRAYPRELPFLTNAEKDDILGTTTTARLTPERELELLKDSGCQSTCGVTGCGPACLCLINGIVCDDRLCPCEEWSCKNDREDLDREEPDIFQMRLEIANFELEDQSFGSDQHTISSIDNDSIVSLYETDPDDMVDETGEAAMDNIDDQRPPDSLDRRDLDGEDVYGMMERDDDEEADTESSDESGNPINMRNKMADDMMDWLGGLDKKKDESMDSNDDSVPRVNPEAVDDDDENEAEGEEDDEPMHNADDSDSDDDNVQPFNGQIPDLGIDMSPEQFPASLLELLPIVLNAASRDSCLDDNWLESQAIFIGMLREATRYNDNHEGSGKRCAVLHPEAFHQAMELAKKDDKEKKRLKAAGNKTAAAPLILDPQVVAQSAVYANEWTEMIVPMHLFRTHWAVAVVMRSSVTAVIFDSAKKLEERPKEVTELIKDGLRKVLQAAQGINNNDTTTGQFKIRLTRIDYRLKQSDDHSCGLFSIIHARRALERGNSNVSNRKGKNDPQPNPAAERRALRSTIVDVMDFYAVLKRQKMKLIHGPAGSLPFSPAKVALTVVYSAPSKRVLRKRR